MIVESVESSNVEKAIENIAVAVQKLEEEIAFLKTIALPTYKIKSTTGDFASGASYDHVINTVDNTLKVYAGGAWRTLASW